jgi:hypothetical protein
VDALPAKLTFQSSPAGFCGLENLQKRSPAPSRFDLHIYPGKAAPPESPENAPKTGHFSPPEKCAFTRASRGDGTL